MNPTILPPLPQEDLNHVLSSTSGLWDEIRGGRIFVTGGTGFFGTWLIESLVRANHDLGLDANVVVLSRHPTRFLARLPHLVAAPGLTFVEGDVREFRPPEGRFTHVIHAATEASATLNDEEPLRMLDTIVAGTRRVLDFCAAAGVGKLLLTSSGAVYGKQPAEMTHIPETYAGAPDPLDLRSAYGAGKRMAEQLCAQYARQHRFEVKIARCFAFVGPHLPLDAHFAVGNFIRDALHGGPIRVTGDGTPMRSYLYAADLAAWLWTILFRGESARAYNVGSRYDLSIARVATTVAAVLDRRAEVVIAQPPAQPPSVLRYVPDVGRAQTELNLHERVGLSDAIRRTFAWYRGAEAFR